MARNIQTVEVTAHGLRTLDRPIERRMRDRHGKLRRITELVGDPEMVMVRLAGGGWYTVLNGQSAEVTVLDPKCQCGCGTTTKGGFWAPGHDGRIAGVGARALSGDRDALRALASVSPNSLPTGRPSEVEHNPEANCDASCQFAHRSLCVCNCGGTGHFMGWVRAGHMLITEVPEVLTAEARREWGTYTYTEGRRAHEAHGIVETGPISHIPHDAQRVESPRYGEEDLDAYLRRVISLDGPAIEGDCPNGGQLLDFGEWVTAGRPTRVPCPTCERQVAVRPTGRLYAHQVTTANATT